jgi:metallo-beta-lactamase class B
VSDHGLEEVPVAYTNRTLVRVLFVLACGFGLIAIACSQVLPAGGPTKERLASDNKLFLSVEKTRLKWEDPTEPAKIVGPIYFVGTKGLGVFLFATSAGHILMNTGMPSSLPMIVDSIRKLGFRPEDIKVISTATPV